MEPASLWLVTAAVVAGLVVTGFTAGGRGVPTAQLSAQDTQVSSSAKTGAQPDGTGLRLLSRAALASHAQAFQGRELLDISGRTWLVVVSHRRGLPVLPDGMLGMSGPMVRVLAAHYRLAVTSGGQAAGREAQVVTARRGDGTLAARFWLDAATDLPLRKQVFGPRGRLLASAALVRVSLGQASGPAERPWGRAIGPAALRVLRRAGWPLPAPVPGSLALVSAREKETASGPLVDLDYTDGLSVVSVFVQRGHLSPQLRGWRRATVAGHRVYADDSAGDRVAWSTRGYAVTLVSAASPKTVWRVAGALPHDDDQAGVLGRVGYGLHRLLAWLTP